MVAADVQPLKAPFPHFGGKSRVASLVWDAFGKVPNYVEPFFGSGAVLLSRPHPPKIETVNDLDGYIANFWRALQNAPEEVAYWADWPVSELDLHARHRWLMNDASEHVKRLREDPEYFDAKIAGWWVWGKCQWIGSGWCEDRRGAGSSQIPHLGDAGLGLHRPSQKLPELDHERGICRVHKKRPHLWSSKGINAERGRVLREYLGALSDRLRRVRVCCGNWDRILGPTPTTRQGMTAVFLDPPYSHSVRQSDLYSIETDVSADVRAWCAEHGSDPLMRIVLCGYAGEGHESLEALGWRCVPWKATGGYGSQGDGQGRENCKKERIWFSPACLTPERIRSMNAQGRLDLL